MGGCLSPMTISSNAATAVTLPCTKVEGRFVLLTMLPPVVARPLPWSPATYIIRVAGLAGLHGVGGVAGARSGPQRHGTLRSNRGPRQGRQSWAKRTDYSCAPQQPPAAALLLFGSLRDLLCYLG